MADKIMCLKEFDALMREGGFEYSLLVMSELEEAAIHLSKAKQAKTKSWAHELYGLAYNAQVDALEMAEHEKVVGQVIDPSTTKYMPTQVEQDLKDIYTKWRGYLQKIGAHVMEVEFN